MNVVELLAGFLKTRGTRLVASWVAVVFVVALVYRAFGDEPLRASQLKGLSLAAAVLVLAVSEIARWTGRRRGGASAGRAPAPASGGSHEKE